MDWMYIIREVEDAAAGNVFLVGGGHSIIEFVQRSSMLLPVLKKSISICVPSRYYHGLSLGDKINGFEIRSLSETDKSSALIVISESKHDHRENQELAESVRQKQGDIEIRFVDLFSA